MPSLFATLRPQVIARDGRCCQYCGTTDAFSYSVDHIISRSQGGIDALCNLVVSCQQCNTLKRGRVWIPRNFNAITANRLDWRVEVLSQAVPQHESEPTDGFTIRLNVAMMNRLAAYCKAHDRGKGPIITEAVIRLLDELEAQS